MSTGAVICLYKYHPSDIVIKEEKAVESSSTEESSSKESSSKSAGILSNSVIQEQSDKGLLNEIFIPFYVF